MIIINRVVLIGRLTKDADLKFTAGKGTAKATICLAVDKYNFQTKKKEADFINVVIWGKSAEAISNYTQKGSLIGISGRIQTRSYEANDGTKRYVTEIVADLIEGVQFLDSKNSSNNSNLQNSFNDFDGDMILEDDGDIPF